MNSSFLAKLFGVLSTESEILLTKFSQRQRNLLEPARRLIIEEIREAIHGSGLAVRQPASRVKDPIKFVEKALHRGKGYEDPFTQITDQIGCRIVTYFAEDIDRARSTLENLLVEHGPYELEEVVDKRLESDPSVGHAKVGYGSLHLILSTSVVVCDEDEGGVRACRSSNDGREDLDEKSVTIEVQIRSLLQDAWADIEHSLNYKADYGMPDSMKRRLYVLAGMLELADKEFGSVREGRARLKSERIEALAQGDYDVGISAESLSKYAQVSPTPRVLFELIEPIPIDPWREFVVEVDWSYILKVSARVRISTIRQLDSILKEVLTTGQARRFVDALNRHNQKTDSQAVPPPVRRAFNEDVIVWLFMARYPIALLSEVEPFDLPDGIHNAIVTAARDVFPDSFDFTEEHVRAFQS